MASTDCYKVNIHSYRFCVSYIRISVSRVGPTRTANSIFKAMAIGIGCKFLTPDFLKVTPETAPKTAPDP